MSGLSAAPLGRSGTRPSAFASTIVGMRLRMVRLPISVLVACQAFRQRVGVICRIAELLATPPEPGPPDREILEAGIDQRQYLFAPILRLDRQRMVLVVLQEGVSIS